jgi:hypothetical protein
LLFSSSRHAPIDQVSLWKPGSDLALSRGADQCCLPEHQEQRDQENLRCTHPRIDYSTNIHTELHGQTNTTADPPSIFSAIIHSSPKMSAEQPKPRKRKGIDELRTLKSHLAASHDKLKTAADGAPDGPLKDSVNEVVSSFPILHECVLCVTPDPHVSMAR